MLDSTACLSSCDRGLKAFPRLLNQIITVQTRESVGIPSSARAKHGTLKPFARFLNPVAGFVEGDADRPLPLCAVKRRRFPVGVSPTWPRLQPVATGATMEVTKWLKPSGKACHELVAARVCRPQRE